MRKSIINVVASAAAVYWLCRLTHSFITRFTAKDSFMQTPANPRTRPLEIAVLNLLYAQYRATGGIKSDNVRAAIAERIEALQVHLGFDVEIPLIAVAKKRLEARRDLIYVAVVVAPLLVSVGNNKAQTAINGWFAAAITSALSDAFRVATSQATLGTELEELAAAKDEISRRRIVENMVVPASQYVDLLRCVIPLSCERNGLGGLWLHELGKPTVPLAHLKLDIEEIAKLSQYLTGPLKTTFDFELEQAVRAYNVASDVKVAIGPVPSVYESLTTALQEVGGVQ